PQITEAERLAFNADLTSVNLVAEEIHVEILQLANSGENDRNVLAAKSNALWETFSEYFSNDTWSAIAKVRSGTPAVN
ncbi:MAG: hypothetical protein AAB425_16030, partial [Bdellovibrionota bacterium]